MPTTVTTTRTSSKAAYCRAAVVLAVAAFAGFQFTNAFAADDAKAGSKHSIKDVMKTGFKGKDCLHAKILDGSATADQKKEFLALTDALVGSKAPKGEQAAWEKRVDTLVKASHAYLDTTTPAPEAAAAFKTASNCKACHSAHKGS